MTLNIPYEDKLRWLHSLGYQIVWRRHGEETNYEYSPQDYAAQGQGAEQVFRGETLIEGRDEHPLDVHEAFNQAVNERLGPVVCKLLGIETEFAEIQPETKYELHGI